MTSSNAGATRICPVCDATNTSFSLFCAECGASLNGASESGATAAFTPVRERDDGQQTSVYEPAPRSYDADENSPHNATDASEYANGEREYQPYWESSANPPAASDRVWSPIEATHPPFGIERADHGRRGFVLGSIAVLLVLAILLLWVWAAVLDQDTRDAIRDFFGFIG